MPVRQGVVGRLGDEPNPSRFADRISRDCASGFAANFLWKTANKGGGEGGPPGLPELKEGIAGRSTPSISIVRSFAEKEASQGPTIESGTQLSI